MLITTHRDSNCLGISIFEDCTNCTMYPFNYTFLRLTYATIFSKECHHSLLTQPTKQCRDSRAEKNPFLSSISVWDTYNQYNGLFWGCCFFCIFLLSTPFWWTISSMPLWACWTVFITQYSKLLPMLTGNVRKFISRFLGYIETWFWCKIYMFWMPGNAMH